MFILGDIFFKVELPFKLIFTKFACSMKKVPVYRIGTHYRESTAADLAA